MRSEFTIRLLCLLSLTAGVAACTSDLPHQRDLAVVLEASDWKLLQLGSLTLTAADYQSQPHLVFLTDQKRVTGSGGCNRLMGSYEMTGTQLRFSQLAGTMMACTKGMDLEQQFHQMMEAVAHWKISQGRLELSDKAGTVMATFESHAKP